VLVHGFEFVYVFLHERWVQDELSSPYEPFVGLLPVHRLIKGAFIYVKLSTNSTEHNIFIDGKFITNFIKRITYISTSILI
jgi:hypothetical protein